MQSHQTHIAVFASLYKRRYKEEPNTIFDLGARDCLDSVGLSSAFPAAVVHAFEANPERHPNCEDNILKHNIILHDIAVHEQPGTMTFYAVTNKDGASSLLHPKEYPHHTITVPVIRLDSLDLQPDLIWADLQGSEIPALKGLGQKLSQVKMINIEVSFKAEYDNQPLFDDTYKFFTENNFMLLTFTWFNRNHADAVFIPRSEARFYELLMPVKIVVYTNWMRHSIKNRILRFQGKKR